MKCSASERLLRDLANPTPDFSVRYPQLFVGDRNPEETATVLRQLLQKAWDARDQRRREWYCHGIAAYYHRGRPDRDLEDRIGPTMTKALLGEYVQSDSLLFALREPPPAVLALESALLYFKNNEKRAAHCPNPECQTPYHFARKKNQKYCSPACAKPVRLAQLRKWWRNNRGQKALT